MKKYLGSVLALALTITGCLTDRFGGADARRGGRWTDGGGSWDDDSGDGDGRLPSCVANNYTPTLSYASPILVPDDGDKVCATRSNPGDGPVNPAIKAALNAGAYAHGMAYGNWELPPCNSTDGTTVNCAWLPPVAFDAVAVAPYWSAAPTGFGFDPAATLGSALANDTWYYCYVKTDGTIHVSTTAPGPSLRYKDGDTTKAFFAFFRTDGAGVIIPYSAAAGHYTYAAPLAWQFAGSTSLRLALFNANGTSTVAMTGYVPPFAASARIAYYLSGEMDASAELQGITAAGWTGAKRTLWFSSGPVGTATGDFAAALPTGSTTQVKFSATSYVSGIVLFGMSEFTY